MNEGESGQSEENQSKVGSLKNGKRMSESDHASHLRLAKQQGFQRQKKKRGVRGRDENVCGKTDS